jgi:hypothetical protein
MEGQDRLGRDAVMGADFDVVELAGVEQPSQWARMTLY